jgi:branched-chain amino acid aminotransferase
VKVWLDGSVHEADLARISVRDHGLTVGDGVFETMKVVDGIPFALGRHLARLHGSAGRLGLVAPPAAELRAAAAELIAAHGPGEVGRLRITLTGGDGPPGTERGDGGPTVLMVTGPARSIGGPAVLATVPWVRNERSPVTGAKTTSYAENVVALAWARERGADEALFTDTRGNVCEGTGSNIFWVRAGRITTAALSTGCLAGVTRGLVVQWCGADEVEEPLHSLADAEEVFVTSSTRDVQAVRAVDGRTYPAPGPVTALAAAEFAKRSAEQPDP